MQNREALRVVAFASETNRCSNSMAPGNRGEAMVRTKKPFNENSH